MKRVVASLASLVMTAAVALTVGGCKAEYDRTEITNVKSRLAGGSMNEARIEVPVGGIVTSHIVSYDDSHHTMSVELHSKDEGIVQVANVVSEHDYAFVGMKPGDTEVELRADGHLVLILRARVTAQPPLP